MFLPAFGPAAAEQQPWQPQLAELREQLASLRQELYELESRPTPDAVLEIKRWLEKAKFDEDVRAYIREKTEQFKAH